MTLEFIGHLPAKSEMRPQDKFSTTEFGFDIFVPFSRQWAQTVPYGNGGLRGSKWTVAPKELGATNAGSMTQNWGEIFRAFVENFDEASAAYPTSQVRSKSAGMASELADILYDAQKVPVKNTGAGAYQATKGELKDYLVMEYNRLDKSLDWEHIGGDGKVEGPAKLNSKEIGFKGEGFSQMSGKGMDFVANTDANQQNLTYLLNRLAAQPGIPGGFVKDIQGLEVTNDAAVKYFQQEYNKVDDSLSPTQRLRKAAKTGASNVMREYKKVAGSITDAYDDFKKSEAKNGPEDVFYIGSQLMDRFWEVTERMFRGTGGQRTEGGAYLYHMPLRGAGFGNIGQQWEPLVGFIRLMPVFKKAPVHGYGAQGSGYGDLVLTNIVTDAWVIDLSIGGDPDGIIPQMAGLSSMKFMIGTISNWLISDAHYNLASTTATNNLLGEGFKRQIANLAVMTSNREAFVGSSVWTMTNAMLQNDVAHMFPIQAVKTLTTPEIAASLKDQFEDFFSTSSASGKEMNKAFQNFYKAAVDASKKITETWLKRIGRNWNDWRGTENSIFSKQWGYAGGLSPSGEGAAIPWFLNYGRDAGGWEEFKDRATNVDDTEFLVKMLRGKKTIGKEEYLGAIPVQMPELGDAMIVDSTTGALRPAMEEEFRIGGGKAQSAYAGMFHRYADPATLTDGKMTAETRIFAHGGTRMGGKGNPFLVDSDKTPFFRGVK